jgi:hypothetical protein
MKTQDGLAQLYIYISRVPYDLPCNEFDVSTYVSTSSCPSRVGALCEFTQLACLILLSRLPLQTSARAYASLMDIVLSVLCILRAPLHHLHSCAYCL